MKISIDIPEESFAEILTQIFSDRQLVRECISKALKTSRFSEEMVSAMSKAIAEGRDMLLEREDIRDAIKQSLSEVTGEVLGASVASLRQERRNGKWDK